MLRSVQASNEKSTPEYEQYHRVRQAIAQFMAGISFLLIVT